MLRCSDTEQSSFLECSADDMSLVLVGSCSWQAFIWLLWVERYSVFGVWLHDLSPFRTSPQMRRPLPSDSEVTGLEFPQLTYCASIHTYLSMDACLFINWSICSVCCRHRSRRLLSVCFSMVAPRCGCCFSVASTLEIWNIRALLYFLWGSIGLLLVYINQLAWGRGQAGWG